MKPIYLYIVPFFPSPKSWRGGFLLDAVKAMVRDGRYDVRVMVPGSGEDYEVEGVKVYRFRSCSIGDSDYLSLFTDWIKVLLFSRKLQKMGVAQKDVSVCHVHLVERLGFYAAWMKRRNPGCLTLIHHHWCGLYGYPGGCLTRIGFVRAIEYLRIRNDYLRVDAHIFCSERAMASVDKTFPGLRFENETDLRTKLPFGRWLPSFELQDACVCYNGVDVSLFCAPEVKLLRQGFRIGCVGNYISSKSQIVLLHAAKLLKGKIEGLKVLLVGTGCCLEDCRRFVAENWLEGVAEFLTEMDHTRMPAFYQSLDLYVLPSYFEAFNCSLIEALGCGVPVMTTDVVSFKEVLAPTDYSRYLFPARDAGALARGIFKLYNERNLGRFPSMVRDLNINRIISEFLDWVDRKRACVHN